MFGRSKSNSPAASEAAEAKPGGKGRPTPSRKEAQAAARERARAGMDKKAAARLLRERRQEQNKKMREGMKSGDERYLPARDRGPERRFVRDWIDSRLIFSAYLVPIMIFVLVLSLFGAPKNPGEVSTISQLASYVQLASILILISDVVMLRLRMFKRLKEKFGDDVSTRGLMLYGTTRMITPRFMRLPKPKVKLGDQVA